MKTPRFSGPFKWSALRQKLLSLREDIQSIQKIAGRNVTIDEHRGKGKVINARRDRVTAAATGACCIDGECSILSEADCDGAGGIYIGDGVPCDPNPCLTGACCDSEDVCTDGVTREDCEAGGGTYLGHGSTCTPVDCTCCPVLARFNTITFSGEVIGCDGGTITLPTKVWTRNAASPGCDLDLYQWSADANCGCQFQAQSCFPFVEADQISIDNTGSCDDPDYGSCLLAAEFFCSDGTVLLSGSTTTGCCPGGSNAQDSTLHGPYDITSGSLDVTYASDSNPSIQFRYIISLS